MNVYSVQWRFPLHINVSIECFDVNLVPTSCVFVFFARSELHVASSRVTRISGGP